MPCARMRQRSPNLRPEGSMNGRAHRPPQGIHVCPRDTHRAIGSIGACMRPGKRRCPKPGSALNEAMLRIRGIGHIPCGRPTGALSKNDGRPHNRPGPNPHEFFDRSRSRGIRVHATTPVGNAGRFVVVASIIVCPPNQAEADHPGPECLALKTQATSISIGQVLHCPLATRESDWAYTATPNRPPGDMRTNSGRLRPVSQSV
ncbi:hypothetical protein BLA23254_00465 [Burkholderia lata]|uniref:Uncharacterized protein n=1 Tax=Burkholderia lata (strain ATCC 17760 / DSM 23089 / LMG 22485 / NCIMB 9086 / R18194 / 383) TaxID=482957 RepID=A0A6P2H7S1_BURL3|nr:hypothetical protein BLA23254_00465 [Burkholderia lata]